MVSERKIMARIRDNNTSILNYTNDQLIQIIKTLKHVNCSLA